MLIVMSIKPTLTDELLKVNSALKSIFSAIEENSEFRIQNSENLKAIKLEKLNSTT